jgi:glutaredoxin
MSRFFTLLLSLLFLFGATPTVFAKSKKVSYYKEKPTLTLYYTPYCPYSQKVLNYLNQIHKTVPMKNVDKDVQAKQELKRIGGRMQVPCLVINGEALYESQDIINWLSQHQDYLEKA